MKIAVLGGDKRMLFAASAFADEGHEVYVAGFDDLLSLCEICVCDEEKAVKNCDIAVLPVRPMKDVFLNAPFSKRNIKLDELLRQLGDKPIFTGFAEQIESHAVGKVYDYADEEDFTLKNAELTAEGAVGILIRDYEGSVYDSDILITGYGRIGKVLARYLRAMGAKVTVAARKAADREKIKGNGCTAVDYPDIAYENYRVIINTVPALVVDRTAVERMRDDVFIIELASAPGGFDTQHIKERDLSFINASGLPGKTAPLAAGVIIKDTIMNILNRGSLG